MSKLFLIDSSVILDVLQDEMGAEQQWSYDTIEQCANQGELAINQLIYAEVSCRFDDIHELDRCLGDFQRLNLPWQAGYLAAKVFVNYRRRGGTKHAPLPDFYIAAHARYANIPLVTRDKRMAGYVSDAVVLCP